MVNQLNITIIPHDKQEKISTDCVGTVSKVFTNNRSVTENMQAYQK
jgi:hypothetical protein